MNKRDLKADLEICRKATQGPWEICLGSGVNLCTTVIAADGKYMICDCLPDWFLDEGAAPENHVPNLQFIAEAREGWPHAIERAVKAETLVREFVEVAEMLLQWWNNGYICQDCPNPSGPARTCISECCSILDDYRQAEKKLIRAKEVLGDV